MISIARIFLDDQKSHFAKSRERIIGVLNQLSDEDVNWRANSECNSITNLILHLCGNLHERYGSNITGQPSTRNRPGEFDTTATRTKAELLAMIDPAFALVDETLTRLPLASLYDTVTVRDQQKSLLQHIDQTATHASEHVGQIIYIAKIRLGPRYQYMLKV
jgi:uncharacterized damage-inducible protein DinB